MNDEGELSCDHVGYVIESTSDLGYSPTFQLSAFSIMFYYIPAVHEDTIYGNTWL